MIIFFLLFQDYDGVYSGDEAEDNSKPGTPALSFTSEGGSSIGSSGNYMMPGLNLSGGSGDESKRSTACNVCFKVFACRSALDIHFRSHTRERPYKCKCCDRSFTTKGNMKQHMLTHKIRDITKPFSENSDGGKTSDNNNSLDAQDMESKSENEFDDDVDDAGVDMPVRSRSASTTPSSSVGPTQTSDSHFDASMHASRHGSIDRENRENQNNGHNSSSESPFVRQTPLKHQCQVCQKGFSSASALQIHIRTHTGDKPFKCNVCGKAFTTKGNLKVHMGTHMWNNSPSRRGRRMSIEPPFMMTHKDNPYMPPGFPHRSPDFFPYQFPPFMNGVTQQKMNEISVIQNMAAAASAGLMPPMGLHPDLPSPHSKPSDSSKMERSNRTPEGHKTASSGELDLSMKSSRSSPSPKNVSVSDKLPSWSANSFLTNGALDHRLPPFHMPGESQKSVVA